VIATAFSATADKERRLGLSKRGDAYLRRQLIHGARAVVRVSPGRIGETVRAAPGRPPEVGPGSQARDRWSAVAPPLQGRGRGGGE
jgi:transposase